MQEEKLNSDLQVAIAQSKSAIAELEAKVRVCACVRTCMRECGILIVEAGRCGRASDGPQYVGRLAVGLCVRHTERLRTLLGLHASSLRPCYSSIQ